MYQEQDYKQIIQLMMAAMAIRKISHRLALIVHREAENPKQQIKIFKAAHISKEEIVLAEIRERLKVFLQKSDIKNSTWDSITAYVYPSAMVSTKELRDAMTVFAQYLRQHEELPYFVRDEETVSLTTEIKLSLFLSGQEEQYQAVLEKMTKILMTNFQAPELQPILVCMRKLKEKQESTAVAKGVEAEGVSRLVAKL